MWKIFRHTALAALMILCGCQSFIAPDEQDLIDAQMSVGEGLTASVTETDVLIQDAPNGRALVMQLSVSITNASPELVYYQRSCSVALERKELDTWVRVWEPGLCDLIAMPLEEIRQGEVYSFDWPVHALLGSSRAEAWDEPIAGEYRFRLWIWRGDPPSAQVIHTQPFQVAAP